MTVVSNFYLEDGRVVPVEEVSYEGGPFLLRPVGAKCEVYRRHRWWGEPSKWKVKDPTKKFLGLYYGWAFP